MGIQVCLTEGICVFCTTLLLSSWKDSTRKSPSTCIANPTPWSTGEQTPREVEWLAHSYKAGWWQNQNKKPEESCVSTAQSYFLNFPIYPSRSGVKALLLCLGWLLQSTASCSSVGRNKDSQGISECCHGDCSLRPLEVSGTQIPLVFTQKMFCRKYQICKDIQSLIDGL